VPPRASELIDDPAHCGVFEGASVAGEAERAGIVRIALWLDAQGAVQRARFRATSCPALIAYAEAACRLAETTECGHQGPTADRIRAAVAGVHPIHRDRADAVALAFERALQLRRSTSPAEEQA
jgi:hypothetical protein